MEILVTLLVVGIGLYVGYHYYLAKKASTALYVLPVENIQVPAEEPVVETSSDITSEVTPEEPVKKTRRKPKASQDVEVDTPKTTRKKPTMKIVK